MKVGVCLRFLVCEGMCLPRYTRGSQMTTWGTLRFFLPSVFTWPSGHRACAEGVLPSELSQKPRCYSLLLPHPRNPVLICEVGKVTGSLSGVQISSQEITSSGWPTETGPALCPTQHLTVHFNSSLFPSLACHVLMASCLK